LTLFEIYTQTALKWLIDKPFPLTVWVDYTEKEKENDKAKELVGGYLKTNTYKEAWGMLWDGLSQEEREEISELPNFDADIFEEITGIKYGSM